MKANIYAFPIICVCLMNCQLAAAQTGNYFSGTSAGANNTTGDYNAFAGYGAGVNNTAGSLNTAFGFYAGASNQSTSYNTSIGAYAGYFTSSSFGENVFVGYRSGFYNSNGFYNVFLGSNAGYTNKSGSYNVIIGSGAGYDNTTGLSNTFIGYASGANNTTASSNTFIGNLSGFSNTTGASNSFFGSGAGVSNTTGANNAIIGSGAGYYNNASDNTFLGYYAGRNNSSGTSNVFVGKSAGFSSTSSNNTFIGKGAGEKNTVGGINTFVGSEAGFNNVNGYHNVFMGRSTAQNNTSGYENTFLGNSAGSVNTTGNKSTALGYLAGPSVNNLTNATAIGHRARVNISNAMVLGSINGVNGATATIKVGIGTNSPGYLLHANGTAAKPGGGSWTAASDRKLKQNIKDFKEGLSIVEQIHPVSFRYNGKADLPTDKEYVGVIAQEIQKIAPYMVGEFTYQDSTGRQETYLDYDATALTYILVNAVKEVDHKYALQIQEKDTQIAELQQELTALKELIIKYIPEAGHSQARLGQNNPNPYTQSTSIPYQVPATAVSAFIKVYSSSGQELKSFELTGKRQGEVILSGGMLAAGTYVYSLFVDGVKIDSKKLVLTH